MDLRLGDHTPSVTCPLLTQTENIVCERYLPRILLQLALAYTQSRSMLCLEVMEREGCGRLQSPTTHAPRGFNNPFRGSPLTLTIGRIETRSAPINPNEEYCLRAPSPPYSSTISLGIHAEQVNALVGGNGTRRRRTIPIPHHPRTQGFQ